MKPGGRHIGRFFNWFTARLRRELTQLRGRRYEPGEIDVRCLTCGRGFDLADFRLPIGPDRWKHLWKYTWISPDDCAMWSWWWCPVCGGMRRHIVERRRVGFCRRCGYDLRASKGACPECGEAIAPEPPAVKEIKG